MKTKILFILLFISSNFFAQEAEEIFYSYIEIAKAIGDLNNDGINDSVTVIQDTVFKEKPYVLKVFFATDEKNYKLYVSSTNVILPKYRTYEDEIDAERKFSEIYINDGALYISHSQLRGHFEHKFLYKKNDFILVGYNEIESDGLGHLTSSYFNLETAELIIRQEHFTTGEVINLEREYKRITPLPKLQDFKPLDNQFF